MKTAATTPVDVILGTEKSSSQMEMNGNRLQITTDRDNVIRYSIIV